MKGKNTKNLRELPETNITKKHNFKKQKPEIFCERQKHKYFE